MPGLIKLPIGPGPAKQLLKVVKAMRKEVDGRFAQLERVLQQASQPKSPRTARRR